MGPKREKISVYSEEQTQKEHTFSTLYLLGRVLCLKDLSKDFVIMLSGRPSASKADANLAATVETVEVLAVGGGDAGPPSGGGGGGAALMRLTDRAATH